jgi:hypothetical protein
MMPMAGGVFWAFQCDSHGEVHVSENDATRQVDVSFGTFFCRQVTHRDLIDDDLILADKKVFIAYFDSNPYSHIVLTSRGRALHVLHFNV